MVTRFISTAVKSFLIVILVYLVLLAYNSSDYCLSHKVHIDDLDSVPDSAVRLGWSQGLGEHLEHINLLLSMVCV